MAYMSQERKKELAPAIKSVLKKYNMKGSISVRHYSTLVVTIKSGALDIIGNLIENNDTLYHGKPDYIDVNPYWVDKHYTGKVKDFLNELVAAMMNGNHDNSDIMTDFFDVGWYIDIHVGRYDKPYVLAA